MERDADVKAMVVEMSSVHASGSVLYRICPSLLFQKARVSLAPSVSPVPFAESRKIFRC